MDKQRKEIVASDWHCEIHIHYTSDRSWETINLYGAETFLMRGRVKTSHPRKILVAVRPLHFYPARYVPGLPLDPWRLRPACVHHSVCTTTILWWCLLGTATRRASFGAQFFAVDLTAEVFDYSERTPLLALVRPLFGVENPPPPPSKRY